MVKDMWRARMKCEKCQAETQVFDSRPREGTIRRRRRCVKCSHRFTTLEIYESERNQILKNVTELQQTVTPKPKPVKKRKLKPRPKGRRIEDLNIDQMTDAELEEAIYSGGFYHDE
jgi:transcriptional regulator NrdR family protein